MKRFRTAALWLFVIVVFLLAVRQLELAYDRYFGEWRVIVTPPRQPARNSSYLGSDMAADGS